MFDHQLTIRTAGPGDEGTLRRLADLDSQPQLLGSALLAEIDGDPVAAIALDNAAVVADPFRPTAGVVRVLETQGRALRATTSAPEGSWRRVVRTFGIAPRCRRVDLRVQPPPR